jgi:hypothetical protein
MPHLPYFDIKWNIIKENSMNAFTFKAQSSIKGEIIINIKKIK